MMLIKYLLGQGLVLAVDHHHLSKIVVEVLLELVRSFLDGLALHFALLVGHPVVPVQLQLTLTVALFLMENPLEVVDHVFEVHEGRQLQLGRTG